MLKCQTSIADWWGKISNVRAFGDFKSKSITSLDFMLPKLQSTEALCTGSRKWYSAEWDSELCKLLL